MNLKKIFFLTIFPILALVTLVTYKIKYKGQPNPLGIEFTATTSISEAYNSWFQQEEKAIWNELATKIKLSYAECQQLKKQWYEDYKHGEEVMRQKEEKNQIVSAATQNHIRAILSDFGLSNNQIPILAWKDSSSAAATDTMLFVNEREFCKLSLKAQKFIIGHEIQHYIHKDCSTNYVIRRVLGSQHDLPGNHPINKLHRFQEIRADIKSALKNPDYAQGYIEFIEILSKKRDNHGITHPKNSLRLTMGKQIASNLA